jgi:mono/diheme cytochrome c family protein
MMRASARALVILVAAGIVAAIGGGLLWYWGIYNLSATVQHTAPVYWLLEIGMRRSVHHHAQGIEAPPLDDPARQRRGRLLYDRHCVQCHGAPGVAPGAFALGMMPTPANLARTSRTWPPAELYWTIRHGVKMTGMPAWEFRLPDADLRSIVAYLRVMPFQTPSQYRTEAPPPGEREVAASTQSDSTAEDQGDPERGKVALNQYACITCHEIPGIVGAHVPVGPPLAGIGERAFIAGVLSNNRQNMVRWIRDPQRFHPGSAMPDLGVSERDARDIAAYLYAL